MVIFLFLFDSENHWPKEMHNFKMPYIYKCRVEFDLKFYTCFCLYDFMVAVWERSTWNGSSKSWHKTTMCRFCVRKYLEINLCFWGWSDVEWTWQPMKGRRLAWCILTDPPSCKMYFTSSLSIEDIASHIGNFWGEVAVYRFVLGFERAPPRLLVSNCL